MNAIQVTTYSLEMTSPEQLVPARRPNRPFRVQRAEVVYPALNRFFYEQVGDAYGWTDRLTWSDEQWLAWVDRPQLQTWIGYVSGTPAGYFELELQANQQVELAYFGLLPPFIGQGLGGALLTQAVHRAWEFDAKRIWVHTCTLDHPSALPNYQKRGFRIFDETTHTQELHHATA